MEIEKNIKASEKLYSIKVESQDKQLILNKNDEKITLKFINDTTEISTLFNSMQKQYLIGFDDFGDLKNYQNKTWYHTKIISNWETKEQLLEKIKETHIPKELCIHLFNVNESIDLFTIAEIMNLTDSKGYASDMPLFNLSLSADNITSYTMLYINKKL
ncbi:MAG: hypothetical protein ACLRT4_02810 [Thomasclavelia sp.]